MSSRTANNGTIVHSSDSKSLWNYTLSPGWTHAEAEVYKLALMKYGIGNYKRVLTERILPGKTVAQLNNQCQRFLGQQSTKAFQGLRVDLQAVFVANGKRTNVKRKNNCIVNTGDNPTTESVRIAKEKNRTSYGLKQERIDAIYIPTLRQEDLSSVFVKTDASKRQTKIERLKYVCFIFFQIRIFFRTKF
eukprot:GSMAST32.ASY1.ANO1.521.1 assembled CDS